MQLTELVRLFHYELWADGEVLASLRRAETVPSQSMRRFAHLIGTQWMWLARMAGEESAMAVWPALSFDEAAVQLDELALIWQERLPQLDPDAEVEYTNSRGERFRSSVLEILTHVIMHGCYHRGQIASDLRAVGAEPACTDFIQAARTGAV